MSSFLYACTGGNEAKKIINSEVSLTGQGKTVAKIDVTNYKTLTMQWGGGSGAGTRTRSVVGNKSGTFYNGTSYPTTGQVAAYTYEHDVSNDTTVTLTITQSGGNAGDFMGFYNITLE
ncbi:MAG: hypothetical protein IKB01_08470 [Lachnospiraceae bacterium]|nr:hypothetical protein [Lachnospiraceae bacterium]